jgi:integrase
MKDLDFQISQFFVRHGKGGRDRSTLLPASLVEPLRQHLRGVRVGHERDLADGFGEVWLPGALAHKYPGAPREWAWQYVFPSRSRSTDPRSSRIGRHHVSDSVIQKAVRQAIRKAEKRSFTE